MGLKYDTYFRVFVFFVLLLLLLLSFKLLLLLLFLCFSLRKLVMHVTPWIPFFSCIKIN